LIFSGILKGIVTNRKTGNGAFYRKISLARLISLLCERVNHHVKTQQGILL